MARRIAAPAKREAHWLLIERLRLVPRGSNVRPYALPGAARVLGWRWGWRLRRRPVLALDDYAKKVAVSDREEILPCPLCGGRHVQPLFAPRFGYRVVRFRPAGCCGAIRGSGPSGSASCTTIVAIPGSWPGATRTSARTSTGAPWTRSGRCSPTAPAAGCSTTAAASACSSTWRASAASRAAAFDLASDAVEEARRRGHHAWHGTPDGVPEVAGGGFDVVTLWSVLAHLARPVDNLAAVRRLLAPGGVLVILTVNANSLLLKAYGDRWGGFTPNHLIFSSPTTLPALLRDAGFAAVEVQPMYGDAVERGEAGLSARQERRLRAAVERGNQSSMLRAVVFASG
jgi:hypothetical protein